MPPRLLRAQEKLEKYATKLDDSPYYLAARILDSECRATFLKDKDKNRMTLEGERKLYVVQKLWERFRDKASLPASYESRKSSEPTLESTEQLSAFHRARCRHNEEQTRPQSQDEFYNYISENPIPLDSCTTSLHSGIFLFNARDLYDSHSLQ
jgi:hypothetical protein